MRASGQPSPKKTRTRVSLWLTSNAILVVWSNSGYDVMGLLQAKAWFIQRERLEVVRGRRSVGHTTNEQTPGKVYTWLSRHSTYVERSAESIEMLQYSPSPHSSGGIFWKSQKNSVSKFFPAKALDKSTFVPENLDWKFRDRHWGTKRNYSLMNLDSPEIVLKPSSSVLLERKAGAEF